MFFAKGDLDEAAHLLEECIALGRRLDSKPVLSRALFSLGCVFYSKNDSTQARALTQEGLMRARELGDRNLTAMALNNLGNDFYLHGDLEQARTLTLEALTLLRELGHYPGVITETLGTIALAQGDLEQATAYFTEGLLANQKLGEKLSEQLIAYHCIGLAKVAVVQNQLIRAARLLSAAEVRYDATKEIDPNEHDDYMQTQDSVRARLGEQTFAAARAEGRIMTIKQILAELEPVSIPESNNILNTLAAFEKRSAIPTHPDSLTPREVEVLRLVAQGLTDTQIAEQLIISPRTVNSHLTSIYGKMRVSSRAAATRYAIEHHLV
jgi:DNA-binding NarL/FixJ family response regulator